MLFNNDPVNPLLPMMGSFGSGVHLIGIVFYAIFMLVVVAVSVGITIIVVRYLLITTKAAQIYIAKNSPAKGAPAAGVASPKAATPATPTKPRTPKTPPTQ
jgi:hypothetical protein